MALPPVVGTNNPGRQVSVNAWNAVVSIINAFAKRPTDFGIDRAPTVERATAMVLIPTDFETIQAAVDALGPAPIDLIELRFLAGHKPTSGLSLSEGDYSRYIITSEPQASAFLGVTGPVALTVGATVTQVGSGATGEVVAVGGWNSDIVLLAITTGTFNTTDELSGHGANSVPRYVRTNVVLCPTFTGDFVTATDAVMPQLACLVAGAGTITSIRSGYEANGVSTGSVASACGVMGCWNDGVRSYRGATVVANGSIFSWNAQNHATSSNAVCWGGVLNCETADLKHSGYYGGQGAHAGMANFKAADASYAHRYGVRGSDLGIVNVDGATANECGVYGFYSFNGSLMSGDTVTALDCGSYGATATGAGVMNLGAATLSGGLGGIYVAEAAQATVGLGNAEGAVVRGATVSGATLFAGSSALRRTDGVDSPTDIVVQGGGVIIIGATTSGGKSQAVNFQTPEGIITDASQPIVSTPALNINVNNWAPSISTSAILNIVPNANRQVTGLVAPQTTGREILLHNDSAFTIRFVNESASSTEANRFALPDGNDYMLHGGQSAKLAYIGSRWRLASASMSQLLEYSADALPPAAPNWQKIGVINEINGPVIAYSYGGQWRRATDGAIVTSTSSPATDTTAPTLSLPTGTSTGTTTGTGGATTNEGNGTLFVVASTSATAPTATQIIAGQNHSSASVPSANITVTSTGAKSLNLTGLTASTAYYIHAAHRDAANNVSNVVSAPSFTTAAAATTTLAALTLSNASIAENTAPGTVIGTISGKTTGSTLSLTSGAGVTDAQVQERFAISGTNLVTGATALDWETVDNWPIKIVETLAGATNTPSENAFNISVTNVAEGGTDTTAPTLSAPTGSSTGEATASVGATTNEANGTIYMVASNSATVPSVTQIKTGKNHLGGSTPSATLGISSTGAKATTISGLAASTPYYGHVVHTDAAGNNSNVVSSSVFTTDAASGGDGDGGYILQSAWTSDQNTYADDFFVAGDPTTYTGISYTGTATHEMMRESGGNANVTCYMYAVSYSDVTGIKIAVEADVQTETAARVYATALAERLGRLPAKIRQNLRTGSEASMIVPYPGNFARAESVGHFIAVSKSRMDTRISQGKLEETMFHEGVHATLQEAAGGKGYQYLGQPFGTNPTIVQAWLDAVASDNKFVTEYAMANHGEDFAETGKFAYILKYRPERIPEPDRTAIQNGIPARLAYFDSVVFPTA